MTQAVLYATGSAVIVDIEESLRRAGIALVAGVRNHAGTCHLADRTRGVDSADIGADLTAVPFLVPLFTPANRRAAVREARARGFGRVLTLVDPTAVIPSTLRLGEGSYIGAAASVGALSVLGDFCFVNRSASLGHHFRADDYVSIGPGVVAAGQVSVGAGTLIGAGAILLPTVRVGAGCLVAAGSVVTRDVPDRHLVAGNPARTVRTDLDPWEAVSG